MYLTLQYKQPNVYRACRLYTRCHCMQINAGKKQLSDNEMNTCLSALPTPIYFVGDSHLRYTLNSIILITDSSARAVNFTLDKSQQSYTGDMFTYMFGGYTVNFTSNAGFLSDPQGLLLTIKELSNGFWRMTRGSDRTTVMDALAKWKSIELQRSSSAL